MLLIKTQYMDKNRSRWWMEMSIIQQVLLSKEISPFVLLTNPNNKVIYKELCSMLPNKHGDVILLNKLLQNSNHPNRLMEASEA